MITVTETENRTIELKDLVKLQRDSASCWVVFNGRRSMATDARRFNGEWLVWVPCYGWQEPRDVRFVSWHTH